jgi:hypothetical protein
MTVTPDTLVVVLYLLTGGGIYVDLQPAWVCEAIERRAAHGPVRLEVDDGDKVEVAAVECRAIERQ